MNARTSLLCLLPAALALRSAGAQLPLPPASTTPAPVPPLDGGTGKFVACAPTSDDSPAPAVRVVTASDAGDALVSSASSSPYFLAFVGGRYEPPQGERIDPRLLDQVQVQPNDGRAGAEIYCMAMLSKRVSPERIAALEALGCRVQGIHPHYALKLALPAASIDAVAALDFVRWLGLPRVEQKVHPRLLSELAALHDGAALDVWINVYESDLCPESKLERVGVQRVGDPNGVIEADTGTRIGGEVWQSNGWQQHALEAQGVEVLEYVDRVRAFRARILPGALEELVADDFVLFVEYAPAHELEHDETMPQVSADYVRSIYDGNSSLDALAGAIDSGLDTAHQALDHLYTVGWDMSSDGNVFQDDCEHGSHVIGTILAKPPAAFAEYTGCAPDLGSASDLRFRIVKFLDGSAGNCTSQGSMSTAFSHMRSDFTDAFGNVSPKPHVINCSFSSPPTVGNPWFGSEIGPRTIDAEVWDYSQLYVFGAGNNGLTVGNYSIGDNGSAKNAFTVGAVADFYDASQSEPDPGHRAPFSAIGPCGDGRWKPNIAAPGMKVRSVDANSTNGYVNKQGTSTATPHVTGIAAELCDELSYVRYQPQRLASLLMASALPHNNQLLITPSTNPTNHLNTYGSGLVNANNTAFIYPGSTLATNWGGTLASNVSAYDDFTVDPNCQRLIVVLTYHEDQCSAGAVPALVNDLDLYLDSPLNGIDPATNTGEYTAQQSSIDNTEIRMIAAPLSGTWRWKVYPQSTTGSTRYSVTVHQVLQSSIQTLDLALSASDTTIQPNQDVDIDATVTAPGIFGSNVFLDSTSVGDTLQASTTTLLDGEAADLLDNESQGRDVLLGALRAGTGRAAQWTTRWSTEGVKTWSVSARSDSHIDTSDSVQITVDGTPPSNVTNLHSTSHTQNVWSNDPHVVMAWTAATDNLSGIDGYSRTWSLNAVTPPDQTKDIEQVTSLDSLLSDGRWYFSIKAVDNSGNWFAGNTNSGGYYIDTAAPNGPTHFTSTTHTVGVPSCNETMTVTWDAAVDPLSGIAGYAASIDTNPSTDPSGALIYGPATTQVTQNIGSSSSQRYLHLRAKDVAGNWGNTKHLGPFLIDANTVSTYCTGKTNSLGCVPQMGWTGLPSKSGGTFTVVCTQVISQKSGIVFWGTSQQSAPFQGGTLCIHAPLVRTPIQTSGGSASGNDCTGTYAFTFDTAYMTSYAIDPGDTVYAQCWMRDPAASFTTGLSNAVKFTVCE